VKTKGLQLHEANRPEKKVFLFNFKTLDSIYCCCVLRNNGDESWLGSYRITQRPTALYYDCIHMTETPKTNNASSINFTFVAPL